MEKNKKEEQIIKNNLDELIGERFGRYSKYVIQERALPDARDGLKPVQRRILYAMNQLGLHHDKSYKKSARIVGEVIGKYHPHGDTSVYDAMVRMSQDWKMRMTLIDMHGNNGSIDGDGAAAMRYTETRLSKLSKSLLSDIEKDTVRFAPNFDDSEWEPTVLPAGIPTLLVNGSTGIAAGYATNIPPHNISEIIKGVIYRIDNPECTLGQISKIVKGPDFPTGGIVQGASGIKDAFKKGRGRIVIRSKIEIEEHSSGDHIIITEIPYEVNKANLVRKMDLIRSENKMPGISEVRDETDRTGLRIAIELKKGSSTQDVINYLYKNTDLQTYYSYNMVSIVDNKPQLLGIIDLIDTYIKHRRDVVLRRTYHLLKRSTKRLLVVDGLIKAISNLEDVINIIRGSSNKTNAKENLIHKYDFKEEQAEAIVTLRLYRLTSTDSIALEKEGSELRDTIRKYNEIIHNDHELDHVIKQELIHASEMYPEKRKSKIERDVSEIKINSRSLIPNEECYVVATRDGYLKRVNKRSYSANKFEDLGKKGNDLLLDVVQTNTLQKVMFFTSKGNYAVVDVHKIKEASWKELGTHINDYVKMSGNEKLITMVIVNSFNNKSKVVIASRRGQVKRVDIRTLAASRYSRTMKCISIKSNDEIVAALPNVNDKQFIIVLTTRGFAVKYLKEAISIIGPKGAGVRSINLKEEDDVVGLTLADDSDTVMFITSTGYAKRIKVMDIPLSARTTKGRYIAKPNKRAPLSLLNMFLTTSNDVYYIDTGDNVIELKAKDVPIFDVTQKFSSIKKKTFFAVTKRESFIIEDDGSDEIDINKDNSSKIVRDTLLTERKSALDKLELKLNEAEKEHDIEKTMVLRRTIEELLLDNDE